MEIEKENIEGKKSDIIGILAKTSHKLINTIDPKIGFIGGTIMGGIVFIINYEYGYEQSGIAMLKQFGYTFLIGGFFSKQSLNIFCKTQNKYKSIIIPSIGTIISTYILHAMKGTPQPFISTIPTAILGPIGFYILQRLYKKALDYNLIINIIGYAYKEQ